MAPRISTNRGIRTTQVLTRSPAPLADSTVLQTYDAAADEGRAELLLVNPPAPDGGIWIRSQHRVGRRSREGMIWPQVSLAQMAALFPDRNLAVVDAIPHRMTWDAFVQILEERQEGVVKENRG